MCGTPPSCKIGAKGCAWISYEIKHDNHPDGVRAGNIITKNQSVPNAVPGITPRFIRKRRKTTPAHTIPKLLYPSTGQLSRIKLRHERLFRKKQVVKSDHGHNTMCGSVLLRCSANWCLSRSCAQRLAFPFGEGGGPKG